MGSRIAVLLFLACYTPFFVIGAGPAAAQPPNVSEITIGTGGPEGVYYPAGAAICQLLNRDRTLHGYSCAARVSAGSIDNLTALAAGEIDLGLSQSDWQYHAFHGSDRYAGRPLPDLRAVLSLHAEPFTVVVRRDSDIWTFQDLQGKRVSVGRPGSGQRNTLEVLLQAMGWTLEDFGPIVEVPADEQARLLCNRQVDGVIYTVGHPNRGLLEATLVCDARLLPVQGAAVRRLLSEYPFYTPAEIPGNMYRGNPDPIPTFGVKAVLLTTAETNEKMVYEVVKTVVENLDVLRGDHPALHALEAEAMAREGLSIPLHPGALRYYREAGIAGGTLMLKQ